MRRSLVYYWRINLAVLAAAAVATAVLTGALLVGDSVRGSLRDLTLERLGEIDHALVTQRYFREELVAALASDATFSQHFDAISSAILTDGNAVHSRTKARASGMNVTAVDESFFSLFASDTVSLAKKSGQIFPSIIINQSLQNELDAEIGDQILISIERPSDIARGSLLGRKDTEDVIEIVRLTLTQIIPDRGVGRFGLQPHQTLPLNAFVSLPVLQKALGESENINAMLVSERENSADNPSTTLQKLLRKHLTLTDFGLRLVSAEEHLSLESQESIISPHVERLAAAVVDTIDAPAVSIFTYLANEMRANGRLLPYSTVAALNLPIPQSLAELALISGEPAPALGENEILLNRWAAEDLNVTVGDSLRMSYFTVGPRDDLFTDSTIFVVKGIVEMAGLGADPNLTPDYPGISDAENMGDWDPPFPIDLNLIRPKDEAYWDRYRGAPKAFVALQTGQQLWGSRFGKLTSIRIGAVSGATLAETEASFENQLKNQIKPEFFGFIFQPVKAQGLASSSGTTDFSGLFIGFSLFLIVAAALLVGLLFRLGVEQRAHEIGTLLAVGFPQRKVRRQLLLEGGILAAVGAVIGLAGAIGYAWVMMVGLRTWWLAAVGTPFLFLHVTTFSLVLGYVISVVVVLLSIWLGFRKLSKIPPPALLAGVTETPQKRRSRRRSRMIALGALALAVGLIVSAFITGDVSSASVFFGIGTLLLISGLAAFASWLRKKHGMISHSPGVAAIVRMAARNSPRNPGRSMLSAALVACACFVIVAVAANRRDFGGEVLEKDSGAGGYALVAEADIPLHHNLSSQEGRFELGFSDEDSQLLAQSDIMPFRLLPGQDASCLNLYQVQRPRILGVPQDQIERGGFRFQTKISDGETENPWQLLNLEIEPGVIPAFGDYNSVVWILHSGLEQDLSITNEFGEEIKLRFVGLLSKSIFQSEVLISEEQFLEHFPSQSGYSYFLIAPPRDRIAETEKVLEQTLTDYGFDVTLTEDKLESFQAVENTYLSTFQTLGGFGLLLGTLGLGIILIRNIIERRGELATLRAFGFRQKTLGLMVLAENGFLLLLGIIIGSLAALIAVAPHVLSDPSQVPWFSLSVTLAVVFVVGMLASSAAVRNAVKIPLLPALRAE